ncbi:substrate-binding domain-containing protein [Chitinimonas sp.]|uniref:substrate-binding and vWA domain-containing protein n=1 Tax=Chitinimonas sp. TaxID=1934313 RepID=UPI0035ADD3D1
MPWYRYLTAGLCALALAACGKQADAPADDPNALTILAGSELKDIEPLLPEVQKATGLNLKLKYAGTLDAVEQIQAGANYDLAWLANSKYALLTPGLRDKIKASERTMISPVILGVKTSKAKALGWDKPNASPSWADIAKAAGAGKFRFAMSNPASSNTGFSAVLGLAAAVAGKGDALELADIDKTALTAFARAQALTAGSSGWLGEAFVREQDRLDGMVNYASVLYAMNQAGGLREPLTLVYPKDGVITADYPLLRLNNAKRADYDKLVAYLKGEAFQKAMTAATFRQPVNTAVPSSLPRHDYFELAFPAKLAVVDGLLDAYQNEFRRPADSTFVVDISGSMDSNGRLDQLRTALSGLAGSDASLSGRFTRFRERERIAISTFSSEVHDRQQWTLGSDRAANATTLGKISDFARNLSTRGGTAIYSAVQDGYQDALARQARDPDRVYSLVLMTDGANNQGLSLEGFQQWFASLPPEKRRIRIFAIQFGEARREQLEALTVPSGGRVFDGSKSGLQAAFKEIRGYQ